MMILFYFKMKNLEKITNIYDFKNISEIKKTFFRK